MLAPLIFSYHNLDLNDITSDGFQVCYSRVQKSIENFVFIAKMAIFQRAEIKEGGLPLPLAFNT